MSDTQIYFVVPKKGSHPYGEGFVQINQDALMKLARDKTMGMQATRVLWLLLARAAYENRVVMDAKAIGDELDMKLSAVYRALNMLRERGLIARHPTMRRDFRINPMVAWKGSVKTLKETLRKEAA